jgi:tetratricopeptide (TPR) repeat protein
MKPTPYILSILLFCSLPALAEDSCDLAKTIAKKGSAAFEKDKSGGLKLFIKARELCPDDPVYAYNLGMAYYQFGHLDKAQPLLEEAVTKKGDRPIWRNNLAVLIMEQGGDPATALRQAEAAAKTDSGNPIIQETLARTRMAAGKRLEALRGLHDALAAAPGDETLKKGYATILDTYLAQYLEAIKAGRVDEGLAGLKAADFEPKAQRAASLALAQTGREEEALVFVSATTTRFPNDVTLTETRNEIAALVARGLYRDFQAGKGAQAVQRSKKLATAYPLKPLTEAYDKLLEAYLADASTIETPQQLVRPLQESGSGTADRLLAELGGAKGSAGAVDLRVDVDENIPRGSWAGPDDVAVVIGNRNYESSGSPNVEYAQRDARVMREYLVKTMGFDSKNIIYEENAPLSKFNEIFGTERDPKGKLAKFVKNDISRVFVYYVGHGAPDLESSEAYFVPVDANPMYLKVNGYRLQTFYENLGRIPARSLTVVLDSCFSGNSEKGMLFKNVSPAMVKVKAGVNGPAKAVVMTSAGLDQVSSWYPEKRHSLFTYYFLKGLQGEADPAGNGKITVGGMRKYLQNNVPYMARRLTGNEQQPLVTGNDDEVLAVVKR